MPRYMMLITHDDALTEESVPQSLIEEMGTFIADNKANGTLIETAGLRPTSEGARVRMSRGKLTVTDGPFTEAKEVIGGYAIFEVGSRTQAIAVAKQFMGIHLRHWPEFEGTCEVRLLEGQSALAVDRLAAHST